MQYQSLPNTFEGKEIVTSLSDSGLLCFAIFFFDKQIELWRKQVDLTKQRKTKKILTIHLFTQ